MKRISCGASNAVLQVQILCVALRKNKTMKTVYDFYTPQCAPCRAFTPTFKKWAKKHADKAEFVSVDITEEDGQEMATEAEITEVPTILVVNEEGYEVARFKGKPQEKELLEILQ